MSWGLEDPCPGGPDAKFRRGEAGSKASGDKRLVVLESGKMDPVLICNFQLPQALWEILAPWISFCSGEVTNSDELECLRDIGDWNDSLSLVRFALMSAWHLLNPETNLLSTLSDNLSNSPKMLWIISIVSGGFDWSIGAVKWAPGGERLGDGRCGLRKGISNGWVVSGRRDMALEMDDLKGLIAIGILCFVVSRVKFCTELHIDLMEQNKMSESIEAEGHVCRSLFQTGYISLRGAHADANSNTISSLEGTWNDS